MTYPEGGPKGPRRGCTSGELALCNPSGETNLSRFFSPGALTRPWAVLCNAFGVKKWRHHDAKHEKEITTAALQRPSGRGDGPEVDQGPAGKDRALARAMA